MRISLPTINDRLSDFDYLFDLWNETHSGHSRVIFDFRECSFLRANAVAFLGGLARLIRQNAGEVSFNWNTLQDKVRANLAQSGFLASFGGPDEPWEGNSIPYREDTHEDGKAITAYLRDQWLGRGWVDVSSLLRDEIISRVVEIYDNAFSHARSPVGITSCGQHFPRLHELTLTAADFGVGIPSTVRAFLRRPDMSAAEAIRWALLSGTTTKPTDISRGLGLDLLKTFVKSHKGRLEIFSDGGRAVINEYVENYVDHDPSFEGTLVNIIIRCDETLYDETSVLTDGPLF